MSKKFVSVITLVVLSTFFVCLLMFSNEPGNATSVLPKVISSSIMKVNLLLKSEVEAPKPVTEEKAFSESEKLQQQLAVLAKELKAIDVAREVNDPNAPEERKAEIVKKMNLYAALVGQYSQLELSKFRSEETQ